jgi:hypothetical protein
MKKSPALRLATIALAVFGLLAVSSCSTAKVKDVWTAPDLTRFNFKKVLVVASGMDSQDGVRRRTAEDSIVHALSNLQAVPSYTFISENDLRDAAKSSAVIKAAGFDGVIIMRMVSERTEINASPGWGYGGWGYGPYWGGYYGRHGYWGYGGYGGWGYGGGGWGATVTTDRIFSIETSIYEFPGEKLVWSGSVESTSPGNVKQMVDDTSVAIQKHMVKQGLIPAPAKA